MCMGGGGDNLTRIVQVFISNTGNSLIIRFNFLTYLQRKFSNQTPILCTNNEGHVTEIHYNNRTMGPLQMPSHLVTPFYHAYRVILANH